MKFGPAAIQDQNPINFPYQYVAPASESHYAVRAGNIQRFKRIQWCECQIQNPLAVGQPSTTIVVLLQHPVSFEEVHSSVDCYK